MKAVLTVMAIALLGIGGAWFAMRPTVQQAPTSPASDPSTIETYWRERTESEIRLLEQKEGATQRFREGERQYERERVEDARQYQREREEEARRDQRARQEAASQSQREHEEEARRRSEAEMRRQEEMRQDAERRRAVDDFERRIQREKAEAARQQQMRAAREAQEEAEYRRRAERTDYCNRFASVSDRARCMGGLSPTRK